MRKEFSFKVSVTCLFKIPQTAKLLNRYISKQMM